MSTLEARPQTRAIVVEEVLPHSPEIVWRVLTDPQMLARWLMKNTFELTVGHRFTFMDRPRGDWNGTVECEVLEVDPPRRLSYSWVGGSASNKGDGAALDSVVTFTLTPVPEGTLFKLVHDGFVSPRNDYAFIEMGKGWATVVGRIDKLAAEIA
jgi:uncharacterized protein YndB with AHSA1/START domain